jgi:hypothetical protein
MLTVTEQFNIIRHINSKEILYYQVCNGKFFITSSYFVYKSDPCGHEDDTREKIRLPLFAAKQEPVHLESEVLDGLVGVSP